MHVIKSLAVLLVLVALCILSWHIVEVHILCKPSRKGAILAVACCVITLVGVLCLKDYVYPFERSVKFTLFASLDIPEEHRLPSAGSKFWHAAYEEYGLYAESKYFNPKQTVSDLGFEWPQMDFEKHAYIITYGQQLLSLSYNVWEEIDIPIRTGAKVGHATLSDDFDPNKVYVYEIAKIRIDNDP